EFHATPQRPVHLRGAGRRRNKKHITHTTHTHTHTHTVHTRTHERTSTHTQAHTHTHTLRHTQEERCSVTPSSLPRYLRGRWSPRTGEANSIRAPAPSCAVTV